MIGLTIRKRRELVAWINPLQFKCEKSKIGYSHKSTGYDSVVDLVERWREADDWPQASRVLLNPPSQTQ